MKRAILLAVVLVGGAFYLGWFTFTTDNSGPNEHVNIVINKDKVHADEARAVEKLHAYEQQIETQGQNASQDLPPADRSARRPVTGPQYNNAQSPGFDMNNTPLQASGGQPAGFGTQPAGYGNQTSEPPAAGADPYELPDDEPRPVTRPSARPAGGTGADSFSRGFE